MAAKLRPEIQGRIYDPAGWRAHLQAVSRTGTRHHFQLYAASRAVDAAE